MKVLMINSVCSIRSTGRICTDVLDALLACGDEGRIAYGRENVLEKYQKYTYRISSPSDVKLDGLKSRIFDNAGFNSVATTKKFIKWVEEYDPDLIHLHNLHGYYINVEVLFNYLKKAKKPVIWTMHDCWAFTGHCSHFVRMNCDKWLTGCHHCPNKRGYPSSMLLDNSKKNYLKKKELFSGMENMTIVTPSQWLADMVGQSFLKDTKIKVINNGINTSVFKPTESNFREKYGLQDKRILLGVASAWSASKGLYDFVKLSERLDNNYKLVLVGLTESQCAEMPSQILAISRTTDIKELAEIYTTADVFINPTYADTYPTVNLEAQACGTPVVTYRTGGSIESVPSENVVDTGNVDALFTMATSDNLEIKEEDFSLLRMVNQYINLYRESI